jgi:hypothetical protein
MIALGRRAVATSWATRDGEALGEARGDTPQLTDGAVSRPNSGLNAGNDLSTTRSSTRSSLRSSILTKSSSLDPRLSLCKRASGRWCRRRRIDSDGGRRARLRSRRHRVCAVRHPNSNVVRRKCNCAVIGWIRHWRRSSASTVRGERGPAEGECGAFGAGGGAKLYSEDVAGDVDDEADDDDA